MDVEVKLEVRSWHHWGWGRWRIWNI